jgi:hypothetical protein
MKNLKFVFTFPHFLFPILLSLFSLISFTKIPYYKNSDCTEALQICKLGDYYFEEFAGCGIYENLNVESSQLKKTNSMWMQFEVEASGIMEFLIVPNKNTDDIDFVLYQATTCTEKQPIRIMTTGETIGRGTVENCIGQTGLQRNSNDLKELDGCSDFDDNFLKPVFLEQGKKYYLFINNFNSNEGFSILFAGDDNLKLKNFCEDKDMREDDIKIFPIPATELIQVSVNSPITAPTKIQVFDQTGKLFFVSNENLISQNFEIDISSYPSGKYFLRLTNKFKARLFSFIKI